MLDCAVGAFGGMWKTWFREMLEKYQSKLIEIHFKTEFASKPFNIADVD